MRRIRRHLTFANVASAIALFVALGGGTAVALSGSNTVFSDDIVNDQVRSADVRDDTLSGGGLAAVDLRSSSVGTSEVAANSLNGGDINESSLGIVPNADQLDGIDSSGFVNQEGATFTDAGLPDADGGSCPSGANGWYNGDNWVGYYRDPFGFVHLRGFAYWCGNATPTSNPITLPPGYRPAQDQHQPAPVNQDLSAVKVVQVFSTGELAIGSPAPLAVSLDGLTFRCGPSGQNGCP